MVFFCCLSRYILILCFEFDTSQTIISHYRPFYIVRSALVLDEIFFFANTLRAKFECAGCRVSRAERWAVWSMALGIFSGLPRSFFFSSLVSGLAHRSPLSSPLVGQKLRRFVVCIHTCNKNTVWLVNIDVYIFKMYECIQIVMI